MLRAACRTLVIGAGDAQAVFRQGGDLLGASLADLLQQRATKCSRVPVGLGTPGVCRALADPLLHLVDQPGNDPHAEMRLGAHVGHQDMEAVEDFEDGADALLPVRLHGADFAQGVAGIRFQRRVPDHASHVLQTGGEAAQLLAAQAMLDHAGPPLGPNDLGNRGGIEAVPARTLPLPLPLVSWWQMATSAGNSEGSVLAARANSFTNEHIFFCPIPGVLDSSANGALSRSSRVRPRKANGSRRSVGKAQ